MEHTISTPFDGLTAEDFSTERPYQLIKSMNLSRFAQRQMVNALIDAGAKVGVKRITIQQFWKDYCDDQRPVKAIGGSGIVEFPEQEQVIGDKAVYSCGKYVCDASGVSYIGPMGEWVRVISHPILPVKRIVDIESNSQNLMIAYCRLMYGENGAALKANWKQMIVPREVLCSAQKVLTLSRNGIGVNSENAKEVVKYLADLEDANYPVMETQLSCSHMGWLPDGQFAPFCENVVFGGDSDEFCKLYSSMHPEGKEDVWMDIARKVRSGNSVPARIALAASFAAPLVSKLGALSFFVHFWGLQGTGKTVALMLGASVWGNPALGGYIKSFSGTKVSQELFAAFCGNLPVFLDELQVISDRKLFDDIIYSLCEGVSKGRGSRDGGLQTSRRWATVFLTTGEMPIVQSNSGGGAAVRTIEVNYGGEPFFENARDVANALKLNYGFAGRRFLEALKGEGVMDMVREAQKQFYGKLAGDIQDKQVLAASLLLTADMLANVAIFQDGKSLTVEDIRPYLITQDQADINQRCYQYLVGWIAANQRRFSPALDDNNHEPWGITESSGGRDLVYIIKPVFEKALSEGGFSPGAFLSWAKRKRLLKTKRYDSCTIQKTIGSARPLCVAVYMPDEAADNSVEDEGVLPFDA